MYQCSFVKYLWKDQDTKRLYHTLERQVNLPFPPVIGLEISEGEWFSGVIERAVWDNQKNLFSVKVMDITPKDGISAELLLEVAEKQGWSIRR